MTPDHSTPGDAIHALLTQAGATTRWVDPWVLGWPHPNEALIRAGLAELVDRGVLEERHDGRYRVRLLERTRQQQLTIGDTP